jgi:hypothetical protein
LAAVRIYKRNETFVELSNLVEELSSIGLTETLKKYYKKPMEHEPKSIVAGPSFIQFLNKLFRIQIAPEIYCNLNLLTVANTSCSL